MAKTHHTKILVIGSGAAGCTASIYAARAMMKPIMVRGMQPGGQMTITSDVENYPGFENAISGPWLMEQMEKQAIHVGTQVIDDMIASVDFSKRPFTCVGESGDTYTADAIIIATGATARWLGTDSEKKFQGYGISACATCDGFFFKGKDVVVVGGGNSAVEEALYLANICNKVTLIHRRDKLRAEKIGQQRLLNHPKISVEWNATIDEFLGGGEPLALTGVRLRNTLDNSTKELKCDGAFIAIGHKPNTEVFAGIVRTDEEGYIMTNAGRTTTNIEGVFAAGDVQDKIFRQAVTAAGSGCMAALEAEKFVAAQGH